MNHDMLGANKTKWLGLMSVGCGELSHSAQCSSWAISLAVMSQRFVDDSLQRIIIIRSRIEPGIVRGSLNYPKYSWFYLIKSAMIEVVQRSHYYPIPGHLLIALNLEARHLIGWQSLLLSLGRSHCQYWSSSWLYLKLQHYREILQICFKMERIHIIHVSDKTLYLL